MKKEVLLTILYDYYGDLLSDKARVYFEAYYFDNLSLGEIALNLNVSRNAVHKQLKSMEEELNFYELKLHLFEKDVKLQKIIDKMPDNKQKKDLKEMMNL